MRVSTVHSWRPWRFVSFASTILHRATLPFDSTQQNGTSFCRLRRAVPASFSVPLVVASAQKGGIMSPPIEFRRRSAIRNAKICNDLRPREVATWKTKPQKPQAPAAIVRNCRPTNGQYLWRHGPGRPAPRTWVAARYAPFCHSWLQDPEFWLPSPNSWSLQPLQTTVRTFPGPITLYWRMLILFTNIGKIVPNDCNSKPAADSRYS